MLSKLSFLLDKSLLLLFFTLGRAQALSTGVVIARHSIQRLNFKRSNKAVLQNSVCFQMHKAMGCIQRNMHGGKLAKTNILTISLAQGPSVQAKILPWGIKVQWHRVKKKLTKIFPVHFWMCLCFQIRYTVCLRTFKKPIWIP